MTTIIGGAENMTAGGNEMLMATSTCAGAVRGARSASATSSVAQSIFRNFQSPHKHHWCHGARDSTAGNSGSAALDNLYHDDDNGNYQQDVN